jgi:hypothetical protein
VEVVYCELVEAHEDRRKAVEVGRHEEEALDRSPGRLLVKRLEIAAQRPLPDEQLVFHQPLPVTAPRPFAGRRQRERQAADVVLRARR